MTGRRLLAAFAAAAVGLGLARGLTTTYVPVLLDRLSHSPALIGAVMLVNAIAGFVVPPIVGVLSDRRARRGVYILGGALVASGGLVLVALGNATGSFVPLTLAAAVTYVGLNSAATAHRALVPERFASAVHARATGAQELAALVGALLATVAGGALIGGAPGLLFAAAALPVVAFAVPTLAMARRGSGEAAAVEAPAAGEAGASGMRPRELLAAASRPGVREVLTAQVLWVLAYAAMPTFMVLYAEHVLGLSTGAAGMLLAAFGVLTAVGLILGGRVPARHVRNVLALGAGLLGGGMLAAAPANAIAAAAPGFAAAAVGAGLVTALGFAYFARFLPAGQEGRYSGLFLSTRAIASAVALPVGGGLIALTGSYRALLVLGAGALLALIPLMRAERTRTAPAPVLRRPLRRVVAVMPVYRSTRFEGVARQALQHVDAVVLVDDGAPAPIAARARSLAQVPNVGLVELPTNGGKGTALAAGIRAALEVEPDAVLLMDSDGQHPARVIPDFLHAAEHADVVVGDRRAAARATMPRVRRAANAVSSAALSLAARRRVPDSQNGMRLIRADVLRSAPHPDGRYEAETRHLKAMLRAGADVAWVPMPAIYEGEPSDFRPLADALRVGRAIVSGARPRVASPAIVRTHRAAVLHHLRDWTPRLAIAAVLTWVVAAMLPLLLRTDEGLLLTINGWGDGPEWLYRALDPHSRNYILLVLAGAVGVLVTRKARHVAGVILAAILAAFVADALLELVQLGVNRPRPEEVLGSEIHLSHGRSWDHIPSFPSGHLIVTTAMVTAIGSAVRWLRGPLIVYLVAVAVTRLTFGAHFPLDVLIGAALGWEVGLFSVGAVRAAGLLPERTGGRGPVRAYPELAPAGAAEREERAAA